MLDNIFYQPYMPPGDLQGTYNLMLIVLAYLVASFSSFFALYIGQYIRQDGKRSYRWLLGGAVTLGVGMWTMHFISMEAFVIPIAIRYDPLFAILSMICIITSAVIAFYITSMKDCNVLTIAVGGIIVGIGICLMHYIGMKAMIGIHFLIILRNFLFYISIAIVATQGAMWLMANIVMLPPNIREYVRLCSGLMMGVAICGIHYIGMASAMYYTDHQGTVIPRNTISSEILSVALALTTILVIGNGVMLAVYHARMTDQKRSTRAILSTVADGIIQIRMNGMIEICNPAAEKIFGFDQNTMQGENFYKFIKPKSENEKIVDLDQFFNSGYKNIELIGRKKNAESFPLEMSISKLNVSQGEFFVITIRDITKRRQSEEELQILNQRFVDLAREAGMSDVVNSVLHNVGNVLNSINISASIIYEKIKQSEVIMLSEIAALIENHRNDMNHFFTHDEKGKKCLEFIVLLSKVLPEENVEVMEETHSLTNKVEHVKHIIQMQQMIGGNNNLLEEVDISSVIKDALSINGLNKPSKIVLKTNFQNMPRLLLNKVKLVQILVNIIKNAKEAITDSEKEIKTISVSSSIENNKLIIEIEDNGMGIDPEIVKKLFSFGFTTKKHGHGFGLHSSLISAKEMGGSLNVQSRGKGMGAKFRLEVPCQMQTAHPLAKNT